MKIDIYTKLVLSVIAVSLATIALKDVPIISTAQANLENTANFKEVVKVEIVSIRKPTGASSEASLGIPGVGFRWDGLDASLTDFNSRLQPLPIKFAER